MFEQTELHVCVECDRLLCEGDGTDEVMYRVDPYLYEIHADDSKRWLCGACEYAAVLEI